MSDEQPSSQLAPIVWGVFWRFWLASLIASVVVGVVVAFTLDFAWGFYSASQGNRLAGTPQWLSITMQVLTYLISAVLSFGILSWAIQGQLGKAVGGFRLALVPADQHERL